MQSYNPIGKLTRRDQSEESMEGYIKGDPEQLAKFDSDIALPIDAALDFQNESLAMLHNSIGRLFKIMQPLLGPGYPQAGDKSVEGESHSAIVGRIEHHSREIREAYEMVNELTSRLQG